MVLGDGNNLRESDSGSYPYRTMGYCRNTMGVYGFAYPPHELRYILEP